MASRFLHFCLTAFLLMVLAACDPSLEKAAAAVASTAAKPCCPAQVACGNFCCEENPERVHEPLPKGSISLKNFRAEMQTRNSHRAVSWEIIRIKTCDSTQLGYAIGNWKITLKKDGHDTTLYGKSMTVWKKQPNGTWKNIQEISAMFPV